ncbi:hypothetical protein [Mediterranea sp. An20]|uniref:hypothetical protein n=1 Tax=Mediterranea sp. An20 TaxID=1965586 RepID=UPI001950CC70|nr:hypothetical protein [Mediterranea sp. An20]
MEEPVNRQTNNDLHTHTDQRLLHCGAATLKMKHIEAPVYQLKNQQFVSYI